MLSPLLLQVQHKDLDTVGQRHERRAAGKDKVFVPHLRGRKRRGGCVEGETTLTTRRWPG